MSPPTFPYLLSKTAGGEGVNVTGRTPAIELAGHWWLVIQWIKGPEPGSRTPDLLARPAEGLKALPLPTLGLADLQAPGIMPRAILDSYGAPGWVVLTRAAGAFRRPPAAPAAGQKELCDFLQTYLRLPSYPLSPLTSYIYPWVV